MIACSQSRAGSGRDEGGNSLSHQVRDLRGVGVREGGLGLWECVESVGRIADFIEKLLSERVSLDRSVDLHHLAIDDQLFTWRQSQERKT
jgi:hypothetical protein